MTPDIPPALVESLRARFGSFIQPILTPVSGGCIHSTHRLSFGTEVMFLKSGGGDMLDLFRGEAEGLSALREARAFKVPKVLACDGDEEKSWLLMEWLDLGPGLDMEKAGHLLALQHRVLGDRHGFPHDNHIGSTPQVNTQEHDWIHFYGHHRLDALAKMGEARGISFGNLDSLIPVLSSFFQGRKVEPSLLHGDLWSGNLSAIESGGVAIYDPAVHYGDRECDLAMTELFGGFSSSFYEAYNESYPIDEGYGRRKGLYQLYHIMNHALLFGGSYTSQAREMIGSLSRGV